MTREVLWLQIKKTAVLIELTVPCEERVDEAHERKQYREIVEHYLDKEWKDMVYPSRSMMPWFPHAVNVENAWDAWHKWENHIRGLGASRKGILMDLLQKRRAQKPSGSKWNLINPTGQLLEVVDVTTVEGRCIMMMGPQ